MGVLHYCIAFRSSKLYQVSNSYRSDAEAIVLNHVDFCNEPLCTRNADVKAHATLYNTEASLDIQLACRSGI